MPSIYVLHLSSELFEATHFGPLYLIRRWWDVNGWQRRLLSIQETCFALRSVVLTVLPLERRNPPTSTILVGYLAKMSTVDNELSRCPRCTAQIADKDISCDVCNQWTSTDSNSCHTVYVGWSLSRLTITLPHFKFDSATPWSLLGIWTIWSGTRLMMFISKCKLHFGNVSSEKSGKAGLKVVWSSKFWRSVHHQQH